MNFRLSLLLILLFAAVRLSAQEEEIPHADKLDRENGFNALKVGAKLSDVKKFLQKDTLDRKKVFDTGDDILDFEQEIYLANTKLAGYDKFYGIKIVRIEVYVSDLFSDEGVKQIDRVKIYLQKGADSTWSNLVLTLLKDYGSGVYTLDTPNEGNDSWLWWGDDTMMYAANFYGAGDTPKNDYYEITFCSTKGG